MPEPNELEGMRNLIGEADAPLTFGRGRKKQERLQQAEEPRAGEAVAEPSRTGADRSGGDDVETRASASAPAAPAAAAVVPGAVPHERPLEEPAPQKTPAEMSEEEMRTARGEPVQTTIYLWPDQKKHLALRKVHGAGDISEQVRNLLDREGACDAPWTR